MENILAECSEKLMNLTVESLNQTIQTDNVSKKELLAKLHELPQKYDGKQQMPSQRYAPA